MSSNDYPRKGIDPSLSLRCGNVKRRVFSLLVIWAIVCLTDTIAGPFGWENKLSEDSQQSFHVDSQGVLKTDEDKHPIRVEPHIHHVPISGFSLLHLELISEFDAVHLKFDDGRDFYAKVEAIIRDPPPPAGNLLARVYLARGYEMIVSLDGMSLMDPQGTEILRHLKSNVTTAEDDSEGEDGESESPPRRLSVAGCHSRGCGTVRVTSYGAYRGPKKCTYATGTYGGFDRCNTPAVVAANYYDPVTTGLGVNSLGCNTFAAGGCSFARKNGWY